MRVAGPVDSVRQAAGDASVVRRVGARRGKHARWPRVALCTDGALRRGAREKTTSRPAWLSTTEQGAGFRPRQRRPSLRVIYDKRVKPGRTNADPPETSHRSPRGATPAAPAVANVTTASDAPAHQAKPPPRPRRPSRRAPPARHRRGGPKKTGNEQYSKCAVFPGLRALLLTSVPHRPPSRHCLGPGDMTLEAQRSGPEPRNVSSAGIAPLDASSHGDDSRGSSPHSRRSRRSTFAPSSPAT